ncbi:MAG: DUF1573 domain-containing protein [Sphingobacteriales bacterium]
MKHFFFAFVALIVANIVIAQSKVADKVKFASEIVDLGTIKQGNPVTGTFTLTNISQEPLVIESVTPGCGCTKSDYTKEPIMAGKTGTITATYNAAAAGNFSKTVYIKFKGIDEQKTVSITGKVLPAAEFDAQAKATPVATSVVPAAPSADQAKAATTKVTAAKTAKKAKSKGSKS